MRAGAFVVALAVVAAVCAGCGDAIERDPYPEGRACQAVEFDTVEAALGVRFETSSAANVERTWSCVLGFPDRSFPELTVVMSASSVDEVIFRATLWPGGATAVEGLGRIAYQLTVAPVAGEDGTVGGPGLRIGWLSAAPQLMVLRYAWAADATPEQVAALTPALIDLAKGIEQRIVDAA